ncbi:hypothetical protein FIBSPDRAFT_373828 [Athelia psychrophila]|uniref:F-box domain-containing protein n=1 Tax=Athelia psychrophila TaxID=1759441 RepID=A0A166VXZ5_9AGAM|nr:hypothetical protein FIBSPDRAFT_373828 [Fibularhizoctonia sp. CBS 109695]
MLFSSLPDDTLLHLFDMVLSEHRRALLTKHPAYSTGNIPIAMKLSQIARSTRALVQNTPLLWTIVDAVVLKNPSHLTLHLKQSRQRLLDILADIGAQDDDVFPKLILLLMQVHRWRRLRLCTTSKKDLLLILASFKNLRLQKLQELHLSYKDGNEIYDYDDDGPLSACRIFQGGTPCLKKLHLADVAAFPCTISTLTHLHLYHAPFQFQSGLWTYSELTEMLSKMQCLRYLSMTGVVVNLIDIPAEGETAFSLPITLQSLKLITEDDEDQFQEYREDGQGNPYITCVLSMLRDTHLTRLYLLRPTPSSLAPIIDDMRIDGLRFLHVTDLYWGAEIADEEDALTFIQAFPAVESLFFMGITGKAILDVLVSSPNAGSLWQHLHTITLNQTTVTEARQVVESRINVDRPLQSLQMRMPKPKDQFSTLEWLSDHLKVSWVPEIYDKCIFYDTE